jgi:hypothetical protein
MPAGGCSRILYQHFEVLEPIVDLLESIVDVGALLLELLLEALFRQLEALIYV